jgi:flagellar motor protein MotB
MRRPTQINNSSEDLNIWQAFTDLMSNAFLIMILFLLIGIAKSASDSKVKDQTIKDSNTKISQLETAIGRLKSTPVIVIKDSDKDAQGRSLKFETGKADLPEGLRLFVEGNVVEKLEKYSQDYQGYVVDIIGHTDGQETFNPASNLDQILEQVAGGTQPVKNLKPGSNADLGLMRALAVMKKLQAIQKKGRLKGLNFRAYSAAQLFLPSGEYAPRNRSSDETRRRIEIRFTPPGVKTD